MSAIAAVSSQPHHPLAITLVPSRSTAAPSPRHSPRHTTFKVPTSHRPLHLFRMPENPSFPVGGPTVTLNSGHSIPLLGFGTWGGGDDAAKVSAAVKEALNAGYRHIDCAQFYGNEPEIGTVIKPFLDSNPRSSLFVTSKVWNTNHHPDHVEPSVRKSIADLQCDYLDLLLIHWPLAWRHTGLDFKDGGGVPVDGEGKLQWAKVAIIDTWRAMEALVDAGLVKSIGVSNFPAIQLQDLGTQARIQPAVNQVENHPYLSQPALVTYCQERGIHVSAYSPLGRPGRTKQESVIFDSTVQHQATHLSTLLTPNNDTFTPATVLLAFNVLRGLSVLPKSSTPERVGHNYRSVLQLLEALSDGEKGGEGKVRAGFMEAVIGLNKNLRYCNAIIAGEKQGKFERQGPSLFE